MNKIRTVWKASLAVMLLAMPPTFANAISKGDSLEEVYKELGDPRGMIKSADATIVFFDRGDVKFEDDRVVSFNVISEETFQRQKAAQEKTRQEALKRAEEQRLAMIERGEEVKADKLSDPSFLAKSAAERLAFWNQFQSVYKDVDVSEVVAETAAEYQVYLEERAREERLWELENRVAAAEDRARRAEQEARKNRGSGFYYGRVYPAVPYYPHSYNRNNYGFRYKKDGWDVRIGGYHGSQKPRNYNFPGQVRFREYFREQNKPAPFQSNRDKYNSIVPPLKGVPDVSSGVPPIKGVPDL